MAKNKTYVFTPSGTLVDMADYAELTSEEGGVGKDDEPKKRTYYQELSTSEKLKVTNFMKAHPELRTLNGLPSPERGHIFEEYAAKELIHLRDVEKERFDAGKPPLKSEEKELVLINGSVVRSVYTHNEVVQSEREALDSRLEASGFKPSVSSDYPRNY